MLALGCNLIVFECAVNIVCYTAMILRLFRLGVYRSTVIVPMRLIECLLISKQLNK